MGSFKLGKMTLGSMLKEPETVQYPTQKRAVPEGLKGHIVVAIDECILCGICMKRCPTSAITVDKGASAWSINRFRCIQCGFCVRECPSHCLTMEPGYASPATKKSVDTFEKPLDPAAGEVDKEAKEAEKAARVKAALEAKAARDAQKAADAAAGKATGDA